MLHSDKLQEFYEDTMVKNEYIYMDSTTTIYLVETEATLEVARVFNIGDTGKAEISIDKKVEKDNLFEATYIIARHCISEYDDIL